jgi:hypothetical protein
LVCCAVRLPHLLSLTHTTPAPVTQPSNHQPIRVPTCDLWWCRIALAARPCTTMLRLRIFLCIESTRRIFFSACLCVCPNPLIIGACEGPPYMYKLGKTQAYMHARMHACMQASAHTHARTHARARTHACTLYLIATSSFCSSASWVWSASLVVVLVG